MADITYSPRYHTFSPDALADDRPDTVNTWTADTDAGRDARARRPLTWAILSICLGLWTVVGFLLWAPLMLSAILRFSLALAASMLSGAEPLEAGRMLHNTVSFYPRGFATAIHAVFGTADREQRKHRKPAARRTARVSRHLVFDVLWTIIFWYLALYIAGALDASPLDGWTALVRFPWADAAADAWTALTHWTARMLPF